MERDGREWNILIPQWAKWAKYAEKDQGAECALTSEGYLAKMAPVSKFTPENREAIVRALRGGNHRSTAAGFGNVAHTTFRNWMLLADDPNAPAEYVAFAEEVVKAEADAEIIRLARISQAGQEGAWQADAWWLERKMPEKWGKKDRTQVELTGADGGPISVQARLGADAAAIGALAAILTNRWEERQDPLAPPRTEAIDTHATEALPEGSEVDLEAFRIAPGALTAKNASLATQRTPEYVEPERPKHPDLEEFKHRQVIQEADEVLQDEFASIVADVEVPDDWSDWEVGVIEDAPEDNDVPGGTNWDWMEDEIGDSGEE